MIMKDIWPIEGSQHHNVSRDVIYSDARIARFLDSNHFTLVVASKGMGKTLLLRTKKKALEEDPSGILLIPRNAEYDEAKLRGTLAQSRFGQTGLWEDIWAFAIIFSILTHRWGTREGFVADSAQVSKPPLLKSPLFAARRCGSRPPSSTRMTSRHPPPSIPSTSAPGLVGPRTYICVPQALSPVGPTLTCCRAARHTANAGSA
jgi:hypothetical protein